MSGPLPRITVIQHGSDAPLDRFANWIPDVSLTLIRAFAGEALPTVTDVGDGLLVLGGSMSAHDDDVVPWLRPTKQLIADVVDAGVPMLGICLGHQLLAEATGGHVAVAAPPGREEGIIEVAWRPEAADDPVLGRIVDKPGPIVSGVRDDHGHVPMPTMHADAVVELPPGATWLGYSAMYPFQAMRVGSALGLQFHPEASPELLAQWALANGEDAEEVLAQARTRDDEVTATGRAIAEAFAAHVRERAPAAVR